MLKDLLSSQDDVTRIADVVIIGAGIAGLAMADNLSRAGRNVLVIESGGLTQKGDQHPFNAVVQLGKVYGGAEHGRFRCLGGTSTRWGGAMLPFQAADMARDWPIGYDDLADYTKPVERLFGLSPGVYDDPALLRRHDGLDARYIARLAKWPPFRDRNVATLFSETIESQSGAEIWLNAVTVGFDLAADGRAASVQARSLSGRELTVSAPEIVIAAGAIESTRLLLLLDRQHNDRLFAPYNILGRYFHDHLSVLAGQIRPTSRKNLNRIAGFRFEGRGMRNLRFEPSARHEVRERVPAGFAHIAFSTETASGFDALRDVYRALQRRSRPTLRQIRQLAVAAPWLGQAAWWRWHEKRLLYPPDARVELHMVNEQLPTAESRITLAPDQIDAFNKPLAAIDWRLSEQDQSGLRASISMFADDWATSNLAQLGHLEVVSPDAINLGLDQTGGIYHPGGSTRLGTGPAQGVLDRDFRTFAIPNLSVVATSAFPTGGGANPTMMLVMAALRTADRINASLSAERR